MNQKLESLIHATGFDTYDQALNAAEKPEPKETPETEAEKSRLNYRMARVALKSLTTEQRKQLFTEIQ